jgi:hypothetical protein
MNNNENNFKTQVELDILLDRKDNYTIDTKNMNLSWNLELEYRSYGVKSTIITIPDQKVTLSLCVWGDDEDTYEEVTLDIKDVVIERHSTCEYKTSFDSLIPRSLQYFKNKWTVVF